MDFETAYRTDVFNGSLSVKLTATYLIDDNQNSTGREEDFRNYVGETASPRWKGLEVGKLVFLKLLTI